MIRNIFGALFIAALRDHVRDELNQGSQKPDRLLLRAGATSTGAKVMFNIVKTTLAAAVVLGSMSLDALE